jgi:hypothetical protein
VTSQEVPSRMACDLLVRHGIRRVVEHPAAYEFELADGSGRRVTLFPGGEDYGDVWTVSVVASV